MPKPTQKKYKRRKSQQWSFTVPLGSNSTANLNQTIDDHRVGYITYSKKKKHILGYVRTNKLTYRETFEKIIGLSNATIRDCPPAAGRDILPEIQINKTMWEGGTTTAQRKIRSDIEKLKNGVHAGKRLHHFKLKICSTHPLVVQKYIDDANVSITKEKVKGICTAHFNPPSIKETMFGNTRLVEIAPGSENEAKTPNGTSNEEIVNALAVKLFEAAKAGNTYEPTRDEIDASVEARPCVEPRHVHEAWVEWVTSQTHPKPTKT